MWLTCLLRLAASPFAQRNVRVPPHPTFHLSAAAGLGSSSGNAACPALERPVHPAQPLHCAIGGALACGPFLTAGPRLTAVPLLAFVLEPPARPQPFSVSHACRAFPRHGARRCICAAARSSQPRPHLLALGRPCTPPRAHSLLGGAALQSPEPVCFPCCRDQTCDQL